ncbi:integrase arm-type DNA-binding domain-containing protein, partial [Burkholderia cenocepacia]|uniref:integrase arm-type DNA-binding domain-containing protein n=1 Tax=Burkholderia cenocepacia TaxID=95486 RepID=UPI0011788011
YTRPKQGNPVRITLGKYGEITIKQASDLAAKEFAKLADGHNPVEEKKQQKQEQELAQKTADQTFKWMMDTYK